MKKVIIEKKESDTVNLSDVDTGSTSIFAVLNGKLFGMLVYDSDNMFWYLAPYSGSKWYRNCDITECMKDASERGYEFMIDVEV